MRNRRGIAAVQPRSALIGTLPMRRRAAVWAAAAAMAGMLASPGPTAAETVRLTLDQGLIVARQALMAGNAPLARGLAQGLLQADAKDPYALLILSAAETELGNPLAGRAAGQAAWRAARGGGDGLRYDIARHTALAALRGGNSLAARLWLRRALDVAPDAKARADTVTDYRDLSARARLHFSAELSLTPTDNLNDGASGKYLAIDDWFVLGALSGSAQALSGLRSDASLRLSYRLAATAQAQTTLALRLMTSTALLSAEAKRLAPDLRSADLNSTKLEGSLTQDFLWPNSQQPISVSLALGEGWTAGAVAGPYARLEAATPLLRSAKFGLLLRASDERHWRRDAQIEATGLAVEGRHALKGGTLGWGVALTNVSGSAINQDYQRAIVSMDYQLGRALGPVTLAAGVSAGLSRYDSFSLLGAQVTDGRTDRQFGVTLDMTFQDISVMGYAPKLGLSTTQTRSNISRFEGHGVDVTFGFESQF